MGKKAVSILLVCCLAMALFIVPAGADAESSVTAASTSATVVLSDNLMLENVTYQYTDGASNYNPGSVGTITIAGTVTGPSNVADVRIATWTDTMPTAVSAREMVENMVSVWQQHESGTYVRALPFTAENSYPVFESDSGKTEYVILAGIDSGVNLVGYAVVEVEVPEAGGGSGNTDDNDGDVVLSDNLMLENVTYRYTDGWDGHNSGSVGSMTIAGTVTGPSNVADVRIATWTDTMPTAASAREMVENMVSVWQQYESSINNPMTPPSTFMNGRPVFESDSGKTEYVILAGIDSGVNLVGYAVVEVEVPEAGGGSGNTDDNDGDVVLSDNLMLENVTYRYTDGWDGHNSGSVGSMTIAGTVNGPSNVAAVWIATWTDTMPTAASAREMVENMVSVWQQYESSINNPMTPPSTFMNGRPIYEDDLGKTEYVILAGVDSGVNLVGYAVVEVEVPAAETPESFTVHFNSNGGSAVPSQTVAGGSTASRPADPTREGFWFNGWYADNTLETAYDFDAAVTEDITLYAGWLVPDLILPDSLTEIGEEAFSGGAFQFVLFPEQTEMIGMNAFANCPYLEYVYIPAGTTDIDPLAFGDRSELTIFGVAGSEAESFAAAHQFTFVAVS